MKNIFNRRLAIHTILSIKIVTLFQAILSVVWHHLFQTNPTAVSTTIFAHNTDVTVFGVVGDGSAGDFALLVCFCFKARVLVMLRLAPDVLSGTFSLLRVAAAAVIAFNVLCPCVEVIAFFCTVATTRRSITFIVCAAVAIGPPGRDCINRLGSVRLGVVVAFQFPLKVFGVAIVLLVAP